MRFASLVFALAALAGCASEPQETPAIFDAAATTIFPGILALPLIDGHRLEKGCDSDDPASACIVVSDDMQEFAKAEAALKAYKRQLADQGWTALTSPDTDTFRSPEIGRCVELDAAGYRSTGAMRVVVHIALDPTPISCWEQPRGGAAQIIMPGVLDLPVANGDLLFDYSAQGSARSRVRFAGKSQKNASSFYVDALVARGWERVSETRSSTLLSGAVGGRQRCLEILGYVVITRPAARSWRFSDFVLRPDEAACTP